MTDDETPRTREIVIEREVDAPPEVVFETLTNPEELRRWFPLDARVDPGEGGKIWLSWGPGVDGEAPIHIWDPPARFGWTESYGDDADGRPIRVAVDFHVEGRDGVTVVRLVQSGFSAAADWDEMYDALKDGWSYFLFNLAFYLEKHRGRPRRMVWRRVESRLSRDDLWERVVGGGLIRATDDVAPASPFAWLAGDPVEGEVVSARPGYHFAGSLPGLDDSIVFIEFEGKHLGIWLSTYGTSPEEARALQEALDARLAEVLGV
jgi:uncharacterized protein YndB with AHSA1/START domain